jgi:hypothetical protein
MDEMVSPGGLQNQIFINVYIDFILSLIDA